MSEALMPSHAQYIYIAGLLASMHWAIIWGIACSTGVNQGQAGPALTYRYYSTCSYHMTQSWHWYHISSHLDGGGRCDDWAAGRPGGRAIYLHHVTRRECSTPNTPTHKRPDCHNKWTLLRWKWMSDGHFIWTDLTRIRNQCWFWQKPQKWAFLPQIDRNKYPAAVL